MTTHDDLIYMAKVTEQTDRFEDMLDFMKKAISQEKELSVEERNLLSVAYKNSVGSRRTVWRELSSIEKKEEAKGSQNLGLIREYKRKIEDELTKFCNDALQLLDSKLILSAKTAESKVYYLKMKGDYHRYVAEYAIGDQLSKASDGALNSYKSALEISNAELKTTNPIRLGLALNFSVFYYEVMNDPQKACKLAKQAFDDTIADIEQLSEDEYKDFTTIMQPIRDSLTLWTPEMVDNEEKVGSSLENLQF